MEKKLTRVPQEKMIAGVAAGIAKYFQLDVTWVRIAFALATFFGGSGLWIYIILWIVVPEDYQSPYTYTDYRTEAGNPVKPLAESKATGKMSLVFGVLLIVMGGYFLMGEFDLLPYWFSIRKLWPLIFVVFGLIILTKATKRTEPVDETKIEDEPIVEDFKNTNEDNTNQL